MSLELEPALQTSADLLSRQNDVLVSDTNPLCPRSDASAASDFRALQIITRFSIVPHYCTDLYQSGRTKVSALLPLGRFR